MMTFQRLVNHRRFVWGIGRRVFAPVALTVFVSTLVPTPADASGPNNPTLVKEQPAQFAQVAKAAGEANRRGTQQATQQTATKRAELLDVNRAGFDELAALPGIGRVKAKAIVEERKRGRFSSVDELRRVHGIGEATLGELRQHVKAGPKN